MEFNTFAKIYSLSEKQQNQFLQFYEMLIEYNQKMNLTAITKFEEVVEKHFFDSLTPSGDVNFDGKVLIDIGAGAGFPSIPLKIMYPTLKVIIIDSLGKRMTFINEVIRVLGLSDIETIVSRGEDYARLYPQSVDLITARAVARLNILVEICLPLLKLQGTFIAYKGMNGLEELSECGNAISLLGGKVEKISEHTLPSEQAKRINILIKKEHSTPSKYPRDFAKIKKNPLK